MIYLAFYVRNNRDCVRRISKGFSCTREEFPREIRIACGPGATCVRWELYHDRSAVDELIAYYKSKGFKDETGVIG